VSRTKEQDIWHKRGFAHGIAVACSTMFGTWGESVAVEEILSGAGLDTHTKMKRLGVDDYDLKILAPIFKTLRERRRRTTAVSRPHRSPAENKGE
jgi:hypothetical protein